MSSPEASDTNQSDVQNQNNIEHSRLEKLKELARAHIVDPTNLALHGIPGAIAELRLDANEKRSDKLSRREEFYESLGSIALDKLKGGETSIGTGPQGVFERIRARSVIRKIERSKNAVAEEKRHKRIFGNAIDERKTKKVRRQQKLAAKKAYKKGEIDPLTYQDRLKEADLHVERGPSRQERKYTKQLKQAENSINKIKGLDTVESKIIRMRLERADARTPKLREKVTKHREVIADIRGIEITPKETDIVQPTESHIESEPTVAPEHTYQTPELSAEEVASRRDDYKTIWAEIEEEVEERSKKGGHEGRLNEGMRNLYRAQIRKELVDESGISPEDARALEIVFGELDAEDVEARVQAAQERKSKGREERVSMSPAQRSLLKFKHMEAMNAIIKPEADKLQLLPSSTPKERKEKSAALAKKRFELIQEYMDDNGIDSSDPAVVNEISKQYLIVANSHDWLKRT